MFGCGSGGGGSCGQVEPCGANLVGNWTVSGACLNAAKVMQIGVDDGFIDICATSTVTNGRHDVSGTFMFNADMTYSASLSVTIGFTWNVPTACLQGATCSAFNAALQTALQQNPDPAIGSIICTGASTCACAFTSPIMPDQETGTYTTSGTAYTTVASDGTTTRGDYCVQGNTVHFPEVDTTMNMGPMGQATIDADVVATKSR
jgi:hypothetical protein